MCFLFRRYLCFESDGNYDLLFEFQAVKKESDWLSGSEWANLTIWPLFFKIIVSVTNIYLIMPDFYLGQVDKYSMKP